MTCWAWSRVLLGLQYETLRSTLKGRLWPLRQSELISRSCQYSFLNLLSSELSVRVVSLEDTSKISLLGGHTRGVRRVTWHPSGTFVVCSPPNRTFHSSYAPQTTSGGDGSVTVWDVSEDEPKLVEVVRGLIPAVNDSE